MSSLFAVEQASIGRSVSVPSGTEPVRQGVQCERSEVWNWGEPRRLLVFFNKFQLLQVEKGDKKRYKEQLNQIKKAGFPNWEFNIRMLKEFEFDVDRSIKVIAPGNGHCPLTCAS